MIEMALHRQIPPTATRIAAILLADRQVIRPAAARQLA